MKKLSTVLALVAIFSMGSVLAEDVSGMDSDADKSCVAIAKGCLDAGYGQRENPGKKFWSDCMKPVLLGNTVSGVNIDSATVQDCRSKKIEGMKKELEDLQNAAGTK